MTETPRAAVYRRRPAQPIDQAGPQRQAAEAWAYVEQAGYEEVLWVDGAELGRDPRELLDEE